MWYKFKCPRCGCNTLNLERTVTSYYNTTCVNIHDYEDDDWKPDTPYGPGDILHETTEKEEYPEPDGVDETDEYYCARCRTAWSSIQGLKKAGALTEDNGES